MNNNLPVKAKNNIFKKFISFVKVIFGKNEKIQQNPIEQIVKDSTNSIKDMYKVENIEFMSKEQEKQLKMEEIIQIIEKEPRTLENISINKLEIIDQYYIDKINEYKNKIANS